MVASGRGHELSGAAKTSAGTFIIDEQKPAQNLTFSQRYSTSKSIGAGGMGVVFVGHDSLLKREVAIKRLKIAANERAWLRFQQEAMACAALHHPNIVSIFDFGADDEGVPYIVLDYLQGQTLAQKLALKGTLTFGEMFDFVLPTLDGLEHAHKNGIVHRDLKPANLFLQKIDRTGKTLVKIMDFGIAKVTSDRESGFETKTGEVVGSPFYISPEQLSGESIDGRADLYSLGCIIFEMLVGRPPFAGENVLATFMLHKSEAAPLLRTALNGGPCSAEVEGIVAKLLEKEPAKRFQDSAELRQALLAAQQSWCANPRNFLEEQEHRSKRGRSDDVTYLEQLRDTFHKPGSIFHSRALRGVGVAFAFTAIVLGAAFVLSEHRKSPSPAVQPERKSIYTGSTGLVTMTRTQVAECVEKRRKGLFISLSKVANLNEVMSIVAQDFPDLNYLQIDSTPATPQAFERLLRMKHLAKIELVDMTGLTPEIIDVIAHIKSVTIFDLKAADLPSDFFRGLKNSNIDDMFLGADLKEQHIKDIAQQKCLRTLNISTASVDLRYLPYLSGMPNLSTLNMDGLSLRGSDIAFMAKMKGLFAISMRSSLLNAGNLQELTPITGIRKLSLEHSREIADADLNELSRVFPNVDFLSLKWTNVTDAGVPCFAEFKRLAELDLSATKVSDKSIPHLVKLEKLQLIGFTASAVTPDGVEKFMLEHPHTVVLMKSTSNPAIDRKLLAVAKKTKCVLSFNNEVLVNDALGEFASIGIDPGRDLGAP